MYSLIDESKMDKFLVSVTSLKATLTPYTIAAIIPEHYTENTLKTLQAVGVSPIVVHNGTLYPYYRDLNIKQKEIFGMIDCGSLGYEKMMFVDYNVYFVKNVDELFDKVGGTITYNPYKPNSDHVSLWVYTPIPYSTQDLTANLPKGEITSARQWINSYYHISERAKVRLPIEYDINVFDMKDYLENPLFNKSNMKVFDVYNDSIDILDIESLLPYDYRVQQLIYDYIQQYNLIIGMYKQLYPELLSGLSVKEKNF